MKQIVMLMGMPRAATTFLYHHFDSHPDIFVPYKRKTNYFSLHFESKTPDWFFGHFKGAEDHQVCVDTETIGFVDKHIDVLGHIEQTLKKNSLFILCVREPGEWIYSLYRQVGTFKDVMPLFETFLSGQYELQEDNVCLPMNYQNGDIKKRITEIIDRFGTRLLLIDYKEIQQDPNQVLGKIEQFLEVKPYYQQHPVSEEKINASDRKNIRILSSMMRNPLLIRLMSYLPVSVVKSARKFFDKLGVRKNQSQKDPQREKNIALARQQFSIDVDYYHQLFCHED